MSLRHIQGHYFFNRYVRFLSVPSATTTSSAINSRKIIFARDNPTPSTSAISRLVVETLFVRYSTITCFCAAVFAVTFLWLFFYPFQLSPIFITDFYHRRLSIFCLLWKALKWFVRNTTVRTFHDIVQIEHLEHRIIFLFQFLFSFVYHYLFSF